MSAWKSRTIGSADEESCCFRGRIVKLNGLPVQGMSDTDFKAVAPQF